VKNKSIGLFITALIFFVLSVLLVVGIKVGASYSGLRYRTDDESYEIELLILTLLSMSISFGFGSFVVYLHGKSGGSSQIRLGLNEEDRG